MKLNQKYSDLHAETDTSVPYLNVPGTSIRLAIPDSRMLSINQDKDRFDKAYGIYANVLTHTEQSLIDVEAQYVIFHPEIEGLKKQLKSNMDITLTGDDYTGIHIHQDEAHRHKVPAPAFAPGNQVIKQTHLISRIFTNNPNTPHQKETHKPIDVAKVGRTIAKVKIGDPEPAADKYDPLANIGAVQYDLVFNAEDEGLEAYLITWYISPTGEVGPPSKPLKFIII